MSLQQALSLMESFDQRFRVLKWRACCTQARRFGDEVFDSGPPNMLEPLDHRSEVLYDVIGGRYAVQIVHTDKWIRGAAPFLSCVDKQAFDGEIYREVSWSKRGLTPPAPQEIFGLGIVSPVKDHLEVVCCPGTRVVETESLQLGLAYMPPFFWAIGTHYSVQPLSRLMRTWLDEGKDVAVVQDGAGAWIITVKLEIGGDGGTACGLPSYEHMFRITYDTRKGGIVTGVRLLAPDETGEYECENARIEVDLQEVAGRFWAPKTVREVWPLDKLMTVTSIEVVEVNPRIAADAFQLDFPRGVNVTDYIQKMYYLTGDNVDQAAATQAFLERTNARCLVRTD